MLTKDKVPAITMDVVRELYRLDISGKLAYFSRVVENLAEKGISRVDTVETISYLYENSMVEYQWIVEGDRKRQRIKLRDHVIFLAKNSYERSLL